MPDQYRPLTSSLRSRLLILTVIFISVFETLVYFPAIAMYRQNYLEERVVAAQIAGLALVEAPFNSVSPALEAELLATTGVISIVIRREDRSLLLGFDQAPYEVNANFDLRSPSLAIMIKEALGTLNAKGDRIVRVIGNPSLTGTRFVEVTLDELALYEGMAAFSNNMLVLSLVVSIFTGILVYLALHWMLVRPMRRIKDNIATFRLHPETWKTPKWRTGRRDEIGVVERELLRMQSEIKQSLKQKTKLAELGEAVAKINHDLRNILATTQLASDSLSRVDHPHVKRVSGRLIRTVRRAVDLCERTMKHGKADEPAPSIQKVNAYNLAFEVAETLGLFDLSDFTFEIDIPKEMTFCVDPDQFHRVLLNLCRNGADVQNGIGQLTVSANPLGDGAVEILVRDKGPGIPDSILPNLFKPFVSGGGTGGGTGLGLAIARDIVTAHGGQIGLLETGKDGSCFQIYLPGGCS